jgi:hypothetical protein
MCHFSAWIFCERCTNLLTLQQSLSLYTLLSITSAHSTRRSPCLDLACLYISPRPRGHDEEDEETAETAAVSASLKHIFSKADQHGSSTKEKEKDRDKDKDSATPAGGASGMMKSGGDLEPGVFGTLNVGRMIQRLRTHERTKLQKQQQQLEQQLLQQQQHQMQQQQLQSQFAGMAVTPRASGDGASGTQQSAATGSAAAAPNSKASGGGSIGPGDRSSGASLALPSPRGVLTTPRQRHGGGGGGLGTATPTSPRVEAYEIAAAQRSARLEALAASSGGGGGSATGATAVPREVDERTLFTAGSPLSHLVRLIATIFEFRELLFCVC